MRAERDRYAAIQGTFSSFTQSYSITAAGGAVASSGPQDAVLTERKQRGIKEVRERSRGGGGGVE